MSQNNITKLIEKFREMETLIQKTTASDKGVLESLSNCLDDFKSQLSPAGEKATNVPTEVINIWSDGACSGNPGPGGWGTIIQYGQHYEELSGYSPRTTNNIMEMTGAIKGLQKTPKGSTIILTSDSQYVVKGMKSWIFGWKKRNWKKADGKPVLNKELWMELDQLASERKINWEWVKGHNEHPQNERCDELARNEISNHR